METYEYPSALENLILELERHYDNFKKIDVFKAVSNACKKIRPMVFNITSHELAEIKELAVSDLNA